MLKLLDFRSGRLHFLRTQRDQCRKVKGFHPEPFLGFRQLQSQVAFAPFGGREFALDSFECRSMVLRDKGRSHVEGLGQIQGLPRQRIRVFTLDMLKRRSMVLLNDRRPPVESLGQIFKLPYHRSCMFALQTLAIVNAA